MFKNSAIKIEFFFFLFCFFLFSFGNLKLFLGNEDEHWEEDNFFFFFCAKRFFFCSFSFIHSFILFVSKKTLSQKTSFFFRLDDDALAQKERERERERVFFFFFLFFLFFLLLLKRPTRGGAKRYGRK